MTMNTLQETSLGAASPFIAACTASCKRLLARIQSIKAALLNEFGPSAFSRGHLLQLALNEAEALAHETGFPLLTFLTLAREKLQAVAAWQMHQQTVRRSSFARLAA